MSLLIPHFFRDEGDSILNKLRKIDHIYAYHRGGVWDCPHCGWGDSNDFKIWFKRPYIKEVHLQTRLFKLAHLVIVSTCPKCTLISWIHYEIDSVLRKKEWADSYPEDGPAPTHYDYELIEKERDRIWAEEEALWNRSLCKTCKHRKNEPFQSYKGKYDKAIECEVTVTERDGHTWTRNPHWDEDSGCEQYVKK